MKKTSATKAIIATLLIFALTLVIVGCKPSGTPDNPTDNPTDNPPDNVGVGAAVDKSALAAELAKEITAEGNYTAASYNEYLSRLTIAKETYNDSSATQADVDSITAALTAARLSLVLKPVTEVAGANKTLTLASGATKEITLSEYISVNNHGTITYTVQSSGTLLTVGSLSEEGFTVTAGNATETAYVALTVSVSHDGTPALEFELFVEVRAGNNGSSDGFTPDDNVDTDW